MMMAVLLLWGTTMDLEQMLRVGEVGTHRHRAGGRVYHSAHSGHVSGLVVYGAVGELELHGGVVLDGGVYASGGLRHVEEVLLSH